MLNITCRITALFTNILIIFFIVPIFISYWKNRLFGQLFLEEISSLIYLSIAVIIMLAIGVIFHKYPLLQKNDYRKTKELGFIGILGVILLLSTLITELFFPNLNTQFSNYAFSSLSFIIVDLIIVITTLTILFKPLSLEYAIESEEIPNST